MVSTNNVFQNQHIDMRIRDGILHIKHKPETHLTLNFVKEMVGERLKLSNGKSFPLCLDVTNVVKVDDDALAYLSEGDAIENITAGAFIVKSGFSRFMATIFMMVKKPPIETKFFTNETSALRWLEYYKD